MPDSSTLRDLPAEQLRQEFSALLAPYAPAQTVHQCGSGVTAAILNDSQGSRLVLRSTARMMVFSSIPSAEVATAGMICRESGR